MSTKANQKKDELLGEPHGTANAKLRKAIIYHLAGLCGMLSCHRCGATIENIGELSIEHKVPWQQSGDPRSSFFDMENIAFSHLRCNCSVPHAICRMVTRETKRRLRLEHIWAKSSCGAVNVVGLSDENGGTNILSTYAPVIDCGV